MPSTSASHERRHSAATASLPRSGGAAATAWLWVALALSAAGCKRDEAPTPAAQEVSAVAPTPAAAETPEPAAGPCSLPPSTLRHPAAERVVAIGDLHGDLGATRAALRLVGAIDAADRWVGGDLVVVQTGDVLDRGDGEREILDLFARLAAEAEAAGGALISLNGNHELMNAAGDLRYVTPGGFEDFAEFVPDVFEPALEIVPLPARGRAAAFRPGGIYAQRLAERPIAAIVGDTVFAHGGILPAYAADLPALDRQVRCWLRGQWPTMPEAVRDPSGPVWSRHYAVAPEACDQLEAALDALGAERMVVGHTTNVEGISSACDGRVWRIDVGLAALYQGPLEVLEIQGESVRVLRGRPEAPGAKAAVDPRRAP